MLTTIMGENSTAAAASLLCGAANGSLPSEKEEMVTTKRAPVGLKEPVQRSFNGVSHTYTSKLNRSAMWTARGEQSYCGADHVPKHHLSP